MPSGRGVASQVGYTYLALLIAVGLLGLGLAAASEVWSQSRQREKEAELLFVGEQFRAAIEAYYERTPGPVKRYPEKLEELLEDKRYLVKQRYLRRLYADPMTGRTDWGLVLGPAGGIVGVYSKSNERPLKTGNFTEENKSFERAQRYSQWRFIYQPVLNPLLSAPAAPTVPSAAR